jgi:hypothetical protein
VVGVSSRKHVVESQLPGTAAAALLRTVTLTADIWAVDQRQIAEYGRPDAGVGRPPSSCRSPNSVRMLFGARAASIAACEYVKPDRIDAA